MNITFIKKIKIDGTPCAKCADVQEQLEKNGQLKFINRIVIADERNPESEGMVLARKFNVDRAPFFIVEQENKAPLIYTVYLKFSKEILGKTANEKDEAADILSSNPDLDFI